LFSEVHKGSTEFRRLSCPDRQLCTEPLPDESLLQACIITCPNTIAVQRAIRAVGVYCS
jgi:hypothetical protein